MSKILFLVNHDVVIYNFRLELAERLLAEGHRVIISSPYGERIDDLKELGCEYHEITMSRRGMNPIRELVLIHQYKKLIRQVSPDIVFSYTIKPNIYGAMACKSMKVPCVANITGLGTAVENGGIIQKITTLLYKYAFSEIQRVYFQNTENMQFFIDRNIAVDKHDLLPGSGVNLQRFCPLEYPSDEKIEFAFVSRIMREKGVDQYLEAAEYLRKKYPNTVFHVCGFCEQAYEDRLRELHEKGIIIYHGMLKDIKPLMKDVHCTIHPTYYPEGISNVLLESCALARPIITTNRSGCREVVDDGVNGYVVKEKDSVDLIEKIESFLRLSHEQKQNMGLMGRAKVERQFDRNIVVEKYLSEVRKI